MAAEGTGEKEGAAERVGEEDAEGVHTSMRRMSMAVVVLV